MPACTDNTADDAINAHLIARFGFPQEPQAQFAQWVRRGLERYTYFAKGEWVGRIKIGCSNEPWRRVRELHRSPRGEAAELVVVLRGEAFETFYHRLFARHLFGNEWFVPHPDILAEIDILTNGGPPSPAVALSNLSGVAG